MKTANILIIEDDPDVACAARLVLRHAGHLTCLDHPDALETLDRAPDLVLLDMNFTWGRSDGREGLSVLARLKTLPAPPEVIVMTAYADIPLAVEALKLGAFDFITKPWDNAKLLATVNSALEQRAQRTDPQHADGLLGRSPAMERLRAMIASVGPTDANVMILGENGVGKELVARALHRASRRHEAVFLSVDMGTLPETTFESELFGHRRGAFTDAREARAGRFQSAAGGTLFLDEVGNLPLHLQAKLLTALERREITPLGADRPVAVDVRIVSATNLDELRLFDPQVFRSDLLFRLNTIVLRIPPLRERREDIPLLVGHFLAHYAAHYGKPVPEPLDDTTLAALCRHDWPGNVRALRHACEQAVILGMSPRLRAADFGLELPGQSPPGRSVPASQSPLSSSTLNEQERETIRQAMESTAGNVSEAARLLGLSRGALYRRLDKHGL